MAKASGAMHVETSRRPHVRKDGTEVVYERHLLRRSFRNAQGKPDKETLANLSALPAEAITAIRAVLAGKTLVDQADAFQIIRSLPHGHVAAVAAMARQLGFPALLGPACRERDLTLALIIILGQLHGVAPDGTARAVDQHALPRGQLRVVEQRLPCGGTHDG